MNVKREKLLKDKDRTTVDIINLKTDTLENDISKYPGVVFPGYHMNHKTWISIMLSDYLEDRMIMEWGCGHFLGLPKRRSQVMPDTLQDSYILMTLLFCLRYTSGDSYPTPG